MEPPPQEELLKLLQLCGSKDELTAFLAKVQGVSPATIAPMVTEWIAALQPLPPPSRQRSAPPALAPGLTDPWRSAQQHLLRRPAKLPPCSAPTPQSATSMMAAMRAIDSRLNRSTQASYSERKASAASKGERLSVHRSMHSLLPPTVPEDAPLAQAHGIHDAVHMIDMDSLLRGNTLEEKKNEDQNLKAYMERHACVHGGCAIAVGASGKRAGGWNYL
eukprot:CAMPEP_0174694808 /NCGR_PEP_ID=MMETSP1094-20130205/1321_1 /TAXON_ID=156173 /ORGANISM="Chrysochromulina brevifilum, Strain UTEX LB 985" /LENGTH=218 /DNA_ID=CAMNT_0015891145 /DNA_START=140 /DNA_END=796 /DNA_ORIENTATION=+